MEQSTKWNCSYCYAKDISTDLRDCPVCGRRRAKEAAVFQDSTPTEPAERAQAAADWICPFCSQENAASAQVCTSCGTSRAESEKRRIELLNRPVSHALPAAEPKEKIDKVLLAKFLFVLILFLATVI